MKIRFDHRFRFFRVFFLDTVWTWFNVHCVPLIPAHILRSYTMFIWATETFSDWLEVIQGFYMSCEPVEGLAPHTWLMTFKLVNLKSNFTNNVGRTNMLWLLSGSARIRGTQFTLNQGHTSPRKSPSPNEKLSLRPHLFFFPHQSFNLLEIWFLMLDFEHSNSSTSGHL